MDRESSDNGMTIFRRAISCRTAAVAFAARVLLPAAIVLLAQVASLEAQMPEPGSPLEGWGMMAPQPPAAQPATPDPATGNVTVVPRTTDPDNLGGGSAVPVEFVAFLTEDGQRIEQGVVWRLYEPATSGDRRGKLLDTERAASPVLSLKPGSYIVNAAFGRAHLTRKIMVPAAGNAARQVEKFVLNAGGLRITALLGGKPSPPGSITYAIHTDRDQTDDRRLILAGAKPGQVIRLNAGIYHVVSTYGDANAIVRSDVTVEAGKLTEATIVHTFAKVSFKLVERAGGEALPDTQWTIQTPEGGVVKESVGALPLHTLAPGRYTVVARNQAKAFRKDFTVQDGQHEAIEIVLQ
jgi:hypothetical protein